MFAFAVWSCVFSLQFQFAVFLDLPCPPFLLIWMGHIQAHFNTRKNFYFPRQGATPETSNFFMLQAPSHFHSFLLANLPISSSTSFYILPLFHPPAYSVKIQDFIANHGGFRFQAAWDFSKLSILIKKIVFHTWKENATACTHNSPKSKFHGNQHTRESNHPTTLTIS